MAAASKPRKPPSAAKPEQPPARPAASPEAFRIDEVWEDTQGRQHRVSPCPTEGLVILTPVKNGKLEPVAMAIDQPYPWRRVAV